MQDDLSEMISARNAARKELYHRLSDYIKQMEEVPLASRRNILNVGRPTKSSISFDLSICSVLFPRHHSINLHHVVDNFKIVYLQETVQAMRDMYKNFMTEGPTIMDATLEQLIASYHDWKVSGEMARRRRPCN